MDDILVAFLVIELLALLAIILYYSRKRKKYLLEGGELKDQREKLIRNLEEEKNKILIERDRIEELRDELKTKQEILLNLRKRKK